MSIKLTFQTYFQFNNIRKLVDLKMLCFKHKRYVFELLNEYLNTSQTSIGVFIVFCLYR